MEDPDGGPRETPTVHVPVTDRPGSALGCGVLRSASLMAALIACGDDAPMLPPPPGPAGDFDAYALLADPYLPARDLAGAARLSSSRNPEAQTGFLNDDWGHYHGSDGVERTLLEATGPGVVTRLWFTMTNIMSDPHDRSVSDTAVMHVYVDGEEIDFGRAEGGVELGQMVSGEMEGLPQPWVAGRLMTGGAVVVAIPFPYSESIRITLEALEFQVYYQVDWRELPAGSEVPPFEWPPNEAMAAQLEAATALWVDRSERGDVEDRGESMLAPGESLEVALDGPHVLRQVEVGPPSLRARLEIDGETIVDEEAWRWTFSAPAAVPNASALSLYDGTSGTMEYPAPVETGARLVLTNEGDAPVDALGVVRGDSVEPPEDLRALRITCLQPQGEEMTNLTLLEVEGRGHYAGQHLSLNEGMYGWWRMEGDHEVFVDGAYPILGTGIEDYFGGAYYFQDGPVRLPLLGVSGWDLGGLPHLIAGEIDVSMYRHHLLGTVPFEETFRWEYEVTDRHAVFDVCLFWYRDLR